MQWNEFFDSYGIKTVTKTDKTKSAYVTNFEQNAVIRAAGIKPSTARPATPFSIFLLNEKAPSVQASYYNSERSTAAHRPPEPRIGREFISNWLEIGDQVLIGNVGTDLFALKLNISTDETKLVEGIANVNPDAIFAKANRAKGKPKTTSVTRNDFVRDPYIVRAALLRSLGKCEMPGCKTILFEKEASVPYLEVHHIQPLSEEGYDTLENAAALCPNCHREQHHGKLKAERRLQLREVIALKTAALLK